ncbi:MAG: M48 family metalloprotease, partial [Candidatus Bathyarchaeota archaeon]
MARLARLKLSMTVSILLVTTIFAAFLVALTYLIRLPPIPALAFAILGTLLFILIQYLIGPAMVRWSTKLRYLKPGEQPWLETTVKALAEKSKIPPPKLAIVPGKTPNAFVFGRTAKGATLAVHEGLLRQLTQEEIQGVIGHELGHIKHKDFVVMTVLSALPLVAYLIARLTFRVALTTGGGSKKKGGEIAFRLLL